MITKDMTIDQIFEDHPAKAQALAHALDSIGLSCVGCNASTYETLEAGVLTHGLSEETLHELIDQLNAIISKEGPDVTTITLTPRAAKKYREILKEEGKLGYGIRFFEKAGGCNGFEYALDYSEKAGPDDVTYQSEEIEVHVPKKMVSRLVGSEIDYIDGLRGSGFKISNPNVRSSCGCGTSHGY